MNSVWCVALLTSVEKAAMELEHSTLFRTKPVHKVVTNLLFTPSIITMVND